MRVLRAPSEHHESSEVALYVELMTAAYQRTFAETRFPTVPREIGELRNQKSALRIKCSKARVHMNFLLLEQIAQDSLQSPECTIHFSLLNG